MPTILDICRGMPEQTFDAGTILLAEGGRTGSLFVLVDGRVQILKGSIQVDVVSEPGAVFGEISALLDIPHTATVKTLTPCHFLVVGHADEFLRSHQEVAYILSKLLAMRLHGMTTYLADLKAQFQDSHDHLGMVDEVLVALLHQQDEEFVTGSDRCPDPI